ncbi:MAG: hypothetical protein P8L85_20310 [Rubripirellula sp.]|nr:hypothetical protein [Rubripirellula sp.]
MKNTTMSYRKTGENLRSDDSSVVQRIRKLPLATMFAVIVLAHSGVLQAAEVTVKFTIHQDEPSLVHVDLGQDGHSHGDLLAFDAPVQATNGDKGKLSGFVLTVDIPEKDHEVFQDRIVSMVFDLGDANTLVISGKSVYPHRGELEMAKNNPQIRAIIGGTGKYIGARGQISTTRDDDGGYTHLVELVD